MGRARCVAARVARDGYGSLGSHLYPKRWRIAATGGLAQMGIGVMLCPYLVYRSGKKVMGLFAFREPL